MVVLRYCTDLWYHTTGKCLVSNVPTSCECNAEFCGGSRNYGGGVNKCGSGGLPLANLIFRNLCRFTASESCVARPAPLHVYMLTSPYGQARLIA